jgi:uncharacterized protein
MNINKIQDFKLKDIILISSLPDMGKVGGLVTQHLTKKLETKKAAEIILTDKPWVNLKDALIELPHDTYTISVNEKYSVVIFTGENQPQEPGIVFEIANTVLDAVGQMGNIKMVISAGGYLPSDNGKGTTVFGVGTDKKAIATLNSYKLKPLSSEVKSITWFNGVILGIAKKRNIEGIGLFGEIQNAESPQYKAAINIIKVIEKILKTKIDTKELDDKVVDQTIEIKKDGPGIG